MAYYYPNDLYHHGIKGQKWGVRRFQNKDGSLTLEGGVRYNGSDYQPRKSLGERISDYKKAKKRNDALKKARAAKEAKKKEAEAAKAKAEKEEQEAKAKAEEDAKKAAQRYQDVLNGKIKTKDMTNEEIAIRTKRLNDEAYLRRLEQEASPTSAAAQMAKATLKKVWNEMIVPTAIDQGKAMMKDYISKALKEQQKPEAFNLEKALANMPYMSNDQVAALSKRLQNEKNVKNAYNEHIKEVQAAEQAKKDAEAAKVKAEKDAEAAKKNAEENAKREKEAAAQAKKEYKEQMKAYKEFQKKERESRENPSASTSDNSKGSEEDNFYKIDVHNRRDYIDPSKEPVVEYPPTVILRDTSTKTKAVERASEVMSNNDQMKMTSKAAKEYTASGQQIVDSILSGQQTDKYKKD